MSQRSASDISAHPEWLRVERHIEEIADVARKETDSVGFYRRLLDRAIELTGAEGGVVWNPDERGDWRELTAAPETFDGSESVAGLFRAGDQQALARPVALGPGEEARGIAAGQSHGLMTCPVVVEGRVACVIEMRLPSELSEQSRASALGLIEAICEVASEFEQRARIRLLEARCRTHSTFESYCQDVHRDLDLTRTGLTIVNDGRPLVGCERLTLLRVTGRGRRTKTRVIVISGMDWIDRRSSQVRWMEKFCADVVRQGESVSYEGGPMELAPRLEASLRNYVDDSHSRRLTAVPLRVPSKGPDEDRREPIGVLLGEDFGGATARDFREPLHRVAAICSTALANSLAYDAIPLRSAWTGLARIVARPGKAIGLLLIALALIAVGFVPVRFTVPARGSLQPEIRRNVFAAESAVVDEVLVGHGDRVEKGQLLLRLSNATLDQEWNRVAGELRTPRQMLQCARAGRFGSPTVPPDGGARSDEQLAADEEQLKENVQSLAEQFELLGARRRDLQATSPIDGRVLTWNVSETLQSRPVQAGQELLTIADPEGPWILELDVEDRDVAHLLDRRRRQDGPMAVDFTLATNPGVVHHGTLGEIALRSEALPGRSPSLRVTARIETAAVNPLHAGARVSARVDCGKRSLGYAWLHDIWETLQYHVFF